MQTAIALLALSAAIAMPPMASATTHDGKAKILLHARAVTTKNVCQAGAVASCQEAVTTGSLNTLYNVYLLGARGNLPNIAALQFGISYAGGFSFDGGQRPIDIFSWRLCATYELASPIPSWPSSGGGNLLVWDYGCQSAEVLVGGYFYLSAYEPAALSITVRPVDQVMKVATCNSTEVTLVAPDDAGYIYFSDTGTPGCNPCDLPCAVVAVEPTTWSRLKAATPGR